MPQRNGASTVEVVPRAREVRYAATSTAAFLGATPHGPSGRASLVRSFDDFTRQYGTQTREHPLTHAVALFFANGGRDAVICRIDPGAAPLDASHVVAADLEARREGLWQLEAVEDVNVICIPPFGPGRDVPAGAWQIAAAYARRRGALLLIDPPRGWTSSSDVSRDAIDALVPDPVLRAWCAIYLPGVRLSAVDDGAGMPASGAVAGVYARTDQRRGVWAAPAGREAVIDGVAGLAGFGGSRTSAITRAEQTRLQALGVNVIRPPDVTAGPTVWGARTLAGADHLSSDWKYVPVRRLASFIEHSLERSLAWAADEPNGEPVWAEARRLADTLMTDLFQRGAVQGVTPREAFVVRCDASTMTQDDIDNGRLVMEVGMAPLRPAEFVILRIGAWTRRPEN
jgi:hypothetical protein